MIPVYEPLLNDNDSQLMALGQVEKFEEAFAHWSGNKYAVAVCNGTAALETAIYALGLLDSLIALPMSTIISCANVLLRTYCEPEFVPITLRCLIDYQKIPDNVQGIMACHLFGNYCDMDKIYKLGKPVIEDFSQYWLPKKVKYVGTYSLYANKLITCGEGGVLITNNKKVRDRARSYRNLCHSKRRFVHYNIGYNFRLSNLQAGFALRQLKEIDTYTAIKYRNYELYRKHLSSILLPSEIPWMNLVWTKHDAGDVCKKLRRKGIDTRRFFYPLHKQPCFHIEKEYPDTTYADYAWNHYFYLPSGLTLTEQQIRKVCTCLKNTLSTMI